ncbi:MAG TPA: glycosyltransferase family 2 protein [Acidimicrobiales bacterium]|nr:glycosyltransferase family 2 protein [Acidimicrobiales bacterium]
MSGSGLRRGVDWASRYSTRRRLLEPVTEHDTAVAVLVGPQGATRPAPQIDSPGVASVVVPTHNDGPNIGVLLARLLDEPEVGEVLVVASACDDETVPTVLEVAERSGGRVRLYVEAERSGKAAAVNFGLGEVTLPFAVIVSGDVLPEPGAMAHLVKALRAPGVGLAGGRPVPVNPPDSAIGHAVHLMWRLHHRLALHQPKLGEMLALRTEAIVTLPRTSVDEACFQALLETTGWRSAYVPQAVVSNRGPNSKKDFLKQRRQIHAGHLWLRYRQQYTVPSLRPTLLVLEIWNDVRTEPEGTSPRRLAWTAGAVAMEAYARARARLDYMQGRENHVWDMVASTKAPPLDTDGVLAGRGELLEGPRLAPPAARQRHDQYQFQV